MGTLLLMLYQAAGLLAFLVATPFLLLRSFRHPEEMRERLGGSGPFLAIQGARRPLWIHAASLGELEGLRSLLQDPRQTLLAPFLLSVLSVSARVRVRQVKLPAIASVCAPLDLFFLAGPFLDRLRPRGLILVETELWPWTLAACHRRAIPVAVISARLSRRRWKGTRMMAPLLRPLIRKITLIAAQSAADADRFRQLGAPNVVVTGNIKYGLQGVAPRASALVSMSAPETLSEASCLFVAGSVRAGEEAVLAAAGVSGVTLILAPRHLRERNHWIQACRKAGLSVQWRSGTELMVPDPPSLRAEREREAFRVRFLAVASAPVFLVDVHGELPSWYAAADLAFVGGTLVPIGGHNLFEPARESVPVAFGPHTGGVADLAEPLLRTGGGTEVPGGAALRSWVERWTADRRGRRELGVAAYRAAEEVAGAAERTWTLLRELDWPLGRPTGSRE